MSFAFWFAPAAAFLFCINRSNLGRVAAGQVLAAVASLRAKARSSLANRPADYPALRGG